MIENKKLSGQSDDVRPLVVMPIPVSGAGGMTTRLKETRTILLLAGFDVITFGRDELHPEEEVNAQHKSFSSEASFKDFADWVNELSPMALLSFNSKLAQGAYALINESVIKVSVLNSVHYAGFYNSFLGIEYCDLLLYDTQFMYNQWRRICCSLGVSLYQIPWYIKDTSKGIAFDKSREGPINLVYVGRLEEANKNISFLLRLVNCLLARSIEFTLNVVGDGPDRNLLKPLEDCANVFFHGYLSEHDRDLVLLDQDILIFPSVSEGFGITLIEACYFGVFPMVNRLPHIEEILGGNCIDLLESEPDQWAEAIGFFSENREALRAHQVAAQKYCRGKYADSLPLINMFRQLILEGAGQQLKKRRSSYLRFFVLSLNSLPDSIRWRFLKLIYRFVCKA